MNYNASLRIGWDTRIRIWATTAKMLGATATPYPNSFVAGEGFEPSTSRL